MADNTGRIPQLPRLPAEASPEMRAWWTEMERWMVNVKQCIEEPTAVPPEFAQLTLLGVAAFQGDIDFTQTGQTVIGTIPEGQTLFILGCYTRTKAVNTGSGSVGNPSFTIKSNGNTVSILGKTGGIPETVGHYQLKGGAMASGATTVHINDVTVEVTGTSGRPVLTVTILVYALLFNT